ncbi:hypothetical protein D9M69_611370 [compost metagenome]
MRNYKSEDTLDFATALGAKAVRLDDVTGSLTVGKRADLVLLRTDRIGFAMLGSRRSRSPRSSASGRSRPASPSRPSAQRRPHRPASAATPSSRAPLFISAH